MKLQRTVRNCRPTIPVPCPKQWEALEETADPYIRHCQACSRHVFFCSTDEQTLEHARAGDCVAREVPNRSEMAHIVLGRPRPPVVETPTERDARARIARERAIDDILAWDLSAYERDCPACGYPLPNFRCACRVCGEIVGRASTT
jgi:hypothetical protein